MSIPRLIHQIWFQGFSNLPDKFESNVYSVKKENPNWKYVEWDESSIQELIDGIGGDVKKNYDSFKILHQKIDFARYVILFTYGGVSVDTDCFALQGFDNTPDLDKSTLIVSWNSNNKFINNATILAQEKHPFLKQLIDNSRNDCNEFTVDAICVSNTTGLSYFNKQIKAFKGDISVLDNTYFEPCSSSDPYCKIPANAILDHRHEKSWINPAVKNAEIAYFWMKHYKEAILLVIAIIALVLVLAFGKKEK